MRGGNDRGINAILECIPDNILVVNRQTRITAISWDLNRSAEQKDLMGKSIREVKEIKQLAQAVRLVLLCLDSSKETGKCYKNEAGQEILITAVPLIKDGRVEQIVVTEKNLWQLEKTAQRLCVEEHEKADSQSSAVSMAGLVYESKKMDHAVKLAARVAKQDITVLIQGESGTGKEIMARLIYLNSARSNKPFVKINCGAIPDNLLESELFGYEKGAFTGAVEEGKRGLFELADGGTLFLDEVATMPLHLQVKLLRAIQEREIIRVGGSQYIAINIRIIAATNVNLKDSVERGEFREDLYYRLNVVPVIIAPLRERKADIYPLAEYFLQIFNKKYHMKKKMDETAWKMMGKYQWPGNVRELENMMERLVVTVRQDTINGADIEALFSDFQIEESFESQAGTDLKDRMEEFERNLILSQLPYYSRSQELADALGIDKSTLTRKMRKYNIKNIYIEDSK